MSDSHSSSGQEQHGAASHGGGHGGGHGGHAKGGHAEGEHEGAPEWLISFADNVALLMGFFVILLAMNMGPKGGGASQTVSESISDQAMLEFTLGVRRAFNNPIRPDSSDPRDRAILDRLHAFEQGPPAGGDLPHPPERNKVAEDNARVDTLSLAVPFTPGELGVSASSEADIVQFADKVRGLTWVIEVRGHASGFEAALDHATAYEISFRRATFVADLLHDAGIPWNQIRLVACADWERLVARPQDAQAAHANERVDVVLTQRPIESQR